MVLKDGVQEDNLIVDALKDQVKHKIGSFATPNEFLVSLQAFILDVG